MVPIAPKKLPLKYCKSENSPSQIFSLIDKNTLLQRCSLFGKHFSLIDKGTDCFEFLFLFLWGIFFLHFPGVFPAYWEGHLLNIRGGSPREMFRVLRWAFLGGEHLWGFGSFSFSCVASVDDGNLTNSWKSV